MAHEVLAAATHKEKGRCDLGPREAFNVPGEPCNKMGFPMLLWAIARTLFSITSADGHTHGCTLVPSTPGDIPVRGGLGTLSQICKVADPMFRVYRGRWVLAHRGLYLSVQF
ncbi:hypothetical protein J6590_009036 [Homalodisca vitripennis]|nr:hypothetical protein J6590_009036 [Homalodisca vitripennis]